MTNHTKNDRRREEKEAREKEVWAPLRVTPPLAVLGAGVTPQSGRVDR